MPIRPPVKAVLRKDLLLGGGAGGLLCALIAGAVLGLGPLLGIDWNGTPDGNGTSEVVALPAIPATSPQAADALRQRAAAPSVIARRNQPTTSSAARRRTTAPAATPTRRPAPSVSTQARQPTVAPRIIAPAPTQDAPAVPAPAAPAAAPAAAAAAAIPATPVTPAKSAKALKLHVASVTV